VFFGVTIGLGAVISSVGLVFSMVNAIRRRQWEQAFLSKTGLAGALFFWSVVFLAVRVIRGGRPGPMDIALLGLPLVALFFRDPLIHLATGHRPLMKEGVFSSLMEGVAEVLESVIYFVSGSVSYLRVAAFALAHGVLSAIVILLAQLVGSPPVGPLLSILVAVIGNAIIIVLEGLIVTIQVVRLHYYEFFSKFFTESGEEFSPFILRAPGGSP
jgi:V/A-type H+-transporting ATPase subunit I